MSKTHTTNYFDTFIQVADDCPAVSGEIPKAKGNSKTVAEIQFEMIAKKPYAFTSDDVLFKVFAQRNDISSAEEEEAREKFFSKGQPCFRASPLTKRYGFGLHANQEGKIAIYGMETDEYAKLSANDNLKKLKAMRTAKK